MDKQLEMVARIETDRQSDASKIGDSEGSVNTVVNYVDDGAEVDGVEKLGKIEAVMTKLNAESEKIAQMLSQIQNTTAINVKPGEDLQAKLDNSKLLEMVGNYQKAVAEIQSQTMEMLLVSFDIFQDVSDLGFVCLLFPFTDDSKIYFSVCLTSLVQ